jgi:hypothetical protein
MSRPDNDLVLVRFDIRRARELPTDSDLRFVTAFRGWLLATSNAPRLGAASIPSSGHSQFGQQPRSPVLQVRSICGHFVEQLAEVVASASGNFALESRSGADRENPFGKGACHRGIVVDMELKAIHLAQY